MFHTLLVYVHLLATCVALGSILGSDIRMLGVCGAPTSGWRRRRAA